MPAALHLHPSAERALTLRCPLCRATHHPSLAVARQSGESLVRARRCTRCGASYATEERPMSGAEVIVARFDCPRWRVWLARRLVSA